MQSDPHQVLNIKAKQTEQTTSRFGSDYDGPIYQLLIR